MKNYLKNRRFLGVFLLISLVVFLFSFKIVLAEKVKDITPKQAGKYLALSEKESQDLLYTLIQVLTTEKIDLEASGFSTAEERAVPSILRKVVRIDVLNHLLIDAPVEVIGEIVKMALEMARLLITQDISAILEKFEKESVEKAVEYGMDFLLQNEIKVSPGAIKFRYVSQKGNKKEVVLQYIIIYQPLDDKTGRAEIRFYSPEPIEPPEVEGSMGGMWGTYHDLQKDLPPFIVRIFGKVGKDKFDQYNWIDKDGKRTQPTIKITFPEEVPDFGIKPLSFWERQILKPLENKIKEIEVLITKITGQSPEILEGLSNLVQKIKDGKIFENLPSNIWNKIKSIFSQINIFLPAVLTQNPETNPVAVEIPLAGLDSDSIDTAKKLEQEIGQEIGQGLVGIEEAEVNLNEIQEQLDDILEEYDVLNQEIIKFVQAPDDIINENFIKEELTKSEDSQVDLGMEKPEESEEEIKAEEEEEFYSEESEELVEEDVQVEEPEPVSLTVSEGGGPGALLSSLPSILISEVCAGWDKAGNEFVELYNPNDFEVLVSGENFKLKLVNSSNKVTTKRLSGFPKTISSKANLLLMAGEIDDFIPDITFSAQLTSTSGVIIVDGQDNILDRAGWGGNEKMPPSESIEGTGIILDNGLETGKSLERKKDVRGSLIDTNNNSQDFALNNNPSPTNSLGQTILYDPIAPETILDSYPQTSTESKEISFSFSSDEKNCTFECSLDSQKWETCGSPKNYVGLNQGDHQFRVRAIDEADNIDPSPAIFYWNIQGSAPQEPPEEPPQEPQEPQQESPQEPQEELKDTTPPQVVFDDISSIQTSLSFTLFWQGIDPVGTASPSGIDGYQLRYSENRENWTFWPLESDWTEVTQYNFEGKDSHTYYFQVRAKDKAGNESEWSPTDSLLIEIRLPDQKPEQEPPSRTIVINEISWMGTKASSFDEWIELYNTTNQDINLFGWLLKSSDGIPDIVFGQSGTESMATTTIYADGLYLLERTDDTAISDILADLIYTGGLGNEGEGLELYDDLGNLIDLVDFSSGWPAGKASPDYISMERISAGVSGSVSSNWASNNLITSNGLDVQGNRINGTPKSENSVSKSSTEITDSNLRFDDFDEMTLTFLGSPYIAKAAIIVPVDKTLNIEPGTTIKFDSNSSLMAEGKLQALGNKDRKITFTSLDSGFWNGIYFKSTSKDSVLDNVIISKGGFHGWRWSSGMSFVYGVVKVEEAVITISNSTIEDNPMGVELIDSDSVFKNTNFKKHSEGYDYVLRPSAAIWIKGSSEPSISNCDFEDNNYDIYWPGGGEKCESLKADASLKVECGCCLF